MNTITLTFNPPSSKPDPEEDVLVSVLRDDGSIEVWEANFDGATWWSSNATMIMSPVVSWSRKPEGVDLRGINRHRAGHRPTRRHRGQP